MMPHKSKVAKVILSDETSKKMTGKNTNIVKSASGTSSDLKRKDDTNVKTSFDALSDFFSNLFISSDRVKIDGIKTSSNVVGGDMHKGKSPAKSRKGPFIRNPLHEIDDVIENLSKPPFHSFLPGDDLVPASQQNSPPNQKDFHQIDGSRDSTVNFTTKNQSNRSSNSCMKGRPTSCKTRTLQRANSYVFGKNEDHVNVSLRRSFSFHVKNTEGFIDLPDDFPPKSPKARRESLSPTGMSFSLFNLNESGKDSRKADSSDLKGMSGLSYSLSCLIRDLKNVGPTKTRPNNTDKELIKETLLEETTTKVKKLDPPPASFPQPPTDPISSSPLPGIPSKPPFSIFSAPLPLSPEFTSEEQPWPFNPSTHREREEETPTHPSKESPQCPRQTPSVFKPQTETVLISIDKNPIEKLLEIFHPSQDSKMEELIRQLDFYSRNGIPEHPHLSPRCPKEELTLENDWRCLVTSHSQLGKREEQQQSAIWELLETEATYISMLKVITDLFLAYLCNLQNEGILNEIDTEKLFNNIQDVYEASLGFWRNFLFPLLQETRNTRQPLDPTLLLNGFSKFEDIFCPYKQYCLEQTNCQIYCKEHTRENSYFKAYLTWCETQKECQRLKLVDILVQPMQRITRYSILLKAILKKTEGTSQRSLLKEMIDHVDKFVRRVNTALRDRHELEKLREISLKIESYDVVETRDEELNEAVRQHSDLNLLQQMPGCSPRTQRWLLHRGDFRLKDAHTSKTDVHVFLFTDFLLLTKMTQRKADKVKVVRPPYRVDQLVVVELKDSSTLGLIHVTEWGVAAAAFTLQSNDPKTCRAFVDALALAKKQFQDARHSHQLPPALFGPDVEEVPGRPVTRSRHSQSHISAFNEASKTNSISPSGECFYDHSSLDLAELRWSPSSDTSSTEFTENVLKKICESQDQSGYAQDACHPHFQIQDQSHNLGSEAGDISFAAFPRAIDRDGMNGGQIRESPSIGGDDVGSVVENIEDVKSPSLSRDEPAEQKPSGWQTITAKSSPITSSSNGCSSQSSPHLYSIHSEQPEEVVAISNNSAETIICNDLKDEIHSLPKASVSDVIETKVSPISSIALECPHTHTSLINTTDKSSENSFQEEVLNDNSGHLNICSALQQNGNPSEAALESNSCLISSLPHSSSSSSSSSSSLSSSSYHSLGNYFSSVDS